MDEVVSRLLIRGCALQLTLRGDISSFIFVHIALLFYKYIRNV